MYFYGEYAGEQEIRSYPNAALIPFLAGFSSSEYAISPDYKNLKNRNSPRPSLLILNELQERDFLSKGAAATMYGYEPLDRAKGLHGSYFTLFGKAPLGVHSASAPPGDAEITVVSGGVPVCCGASFVSEQSRTVYTGILPSLKEYVSRGTSPLLITALTHPQWLEHGGTFLENGFTLKFAPISPKTKLLYVLTRNNAPVEINTILDTAKTLQW